MFIPDPTFFHPGSRSSKKYDPGCSSRIPDPDADFLPSRIQGSKRYPIPDTGSATLGSTVGWYHWTGRHRLVFNFLIFIFSKIFHSKPRNAYIYPIPNCFVGRQVYHFPLARKNLYKKFAKVRSYSQTSGEPSADLKQIQNSTRILQSRSFG
jgi:hypothetical protein